MDLISADKFDRDRAKLLLSAYRPNGADAQDPVFKEALEMAQPDPELARWFREERNFDQMISSKLRLIEPPAGFEAAILAGHGTTSIPRYRFIYWPAISAALVLGLLLLWQMALNIPPKQDRFIAFHSAALADFKPLPRLDLPGTTLQETQEFIQTKAAPTAPALPLALAALSTAGCKMFVWEGQPGSFTCFNLPEGQLLHLLSSIRMLSKANPFQPVFGNEDWTVKIFRI
jgi:hypothetical protein